MPFKKPLLFMKMEVPPLAFGRLGQQDKVVLVFLQKLVIRDLSAASCFVQAGVTYLQKPTEVQQTVLQQICLNTGKYLPAFIKSLPKQQAVHLSITVPSLFELLTSGNSCC